MDQIIDQLHQYLSNHELETALGKLQSIFSLSNSELVNDTILLSAQLKKLQSDKRKGLIDYAQENLSYNHITQGVLSLVQEIRSSPERFSAFERTDQALDQSVQAKGQVALPSGLKDVLYERLSSFKNKQLRVNALWLSDTPENADYEISTLSSIGLNIDACTNSQEALKRIPTASYELVISDIERAGLADEGLRFHQQLLAQGHDIPLIFYVGRADRSRGVPAFAFGIADMPNELMHLVMDVLSRKY